MMDEFALHKGHRYATVVMDADTMRVLWVGEGNSRGAIRSFFELPGEEGCKAIEAIALGMNTAFDLEVRQHCPQAEVVYFMWWPASGRRLSLASGWIRPMLCDQPAARQVIKRSRWLLLRNRTNLEAAQGVKLDELLAANAPLATSLSAQDCVEGDLVCPQRAGWCRTWREWYRLAIDSALAPAVLFAKRLKEIPARHTRLSTLPHEYQHPRRGEQPHQGHQAYGLRIP